jgi:CheY-like chemotaxis protein
MEAVGQLTGGLAHDFNNLLAGISGSLEMIRMRTAQGRMTELGRYIAAALSSVGRAAALTHRLLAFSRRQTLDPKAIGVDGLVGSMEDLFRRTVGPSILIETKLASGLWPVLCDPNQLENALLNLVINACDAMPDGGHLVIETANAALDEEHAASSDGPLGNVPAGEYVALSVTDTGTGMSPTIMTRVFDPFFTTKPLGQGTGLGLSMIYGFVQQSGGHIDLRSEVGQGTTVTIYLPRHLGAVDGAAEVDTVVGLPLKGSAVVLVVEDELPIRMVIADVLSDLGYTVLEASDGRSGLKILEAGTLIDLLITDVGLPGGTNGRQLADAARQRRPDLKVLFITGYAESAAVRNGLMEQGMQVMTKPFALEALAAKIQGILGH